MTTPIRVGLLGCGIVGAATARLLLEHADELARRAGSPIELARVAVRDVTKPRAVTLPADTLTTDAHALVNDPAIDIVVEVMGGIEPARGLLVEAAHNKKHIVTANKELLATLGQEVLGAAEAAGVDLLFEASVAGGIPIIRPLKESLAGDRVKRVLGIVNGTTNYILTRMSETGESFAEALGKAGALGYTELDPSADVEGYDAASKLAILASIAFNARVVAGDVQREGITQISVTDVQAAHDLGYEIKLLAVAEQEEGRVSARVHPAMVPKTHPLASVRDVFNAVFIEGEHAGELMFLGRGAGGDPTASAVVGDIVEIARNMLTGARSVGCTCYHSDASIRPPGEVRVRYYVVLSVLDQPGVLAAVAGVFAKHSISIASVRQEGFGDEATLLLITHSGSEGRHAEIFSELESLPTVKAVTSRMRVIGTTEG
ncbi:MAG: homoserine dehydrogenase [Actinomycetota bacterium]|nr:homoserine dehydrogenase [Actinomycetota bacterium]